MLKNKEGLSLKSVCECICVTDGDREGDVNCIGDIYTRHCVLLLLFRKHSFWQEWLKEFIWLICCKKTKTQKNKTLTSLAVSFASAKTWGKTVFPGAARTSEFRHDALIKHNSSLKYKIWWDTLANKIV